MTIDRQNVEYRTLRDTIRQRGTARMWIILVGLIAAAALALSTAFLPDEFDRAALLLPLSVLIATFEINFFVHTGVERVGRYLQVYYEDQWEETAMALGRQNPAKGDPLLTRVFAITALIAFGATLPGAAHHPGWVGVSFLAYVAFSWRLWNAKQSASTQRERDLQVFGALRQKNNDRG